MTLISFIQASLRKPGLVILPLALATIAGCSSTKTRTSSLPLPAAAAASSAITLNQTWTARITESRSITPAINGGTIYVGNRDGQIRAIDIRTGTEQWVQAISVPLQGTLSANTDLLIATSANGQVIALDTITGKIVWQEAINQRFQGAAQFLPEGLALWSDDGCIYLLSLKDGKQRWMREAPGSALLLHGPRTGSYALGGIFTGTAKGKLAVLDVQSGNAYWEVDLTNPQRQDADPLVDASGSAPLINARHACASTPQRTVCVDRTKGTLGWGYPLGTLTGLESDGLSLFATSPQGGVYSLKADNGKLLWHNTVLKGHYLLKPELMSGSVWTAPAGNASLIQLQGETGTYLAAHPLPAPARWMRALDDHTLILQTSEGQIIRYDLQPSGKTISKNSEVSR